MYGESLASCPRSCSSLPPCVCTPLSPIRHTTTARYRKQASNEQEEPSLFKKGTSAVLWLCFGYFYPPVRLPRFYRGNSHLPKVETSQFSASLFSSLFLSTQLRLWLTEKKEEGKKSAARKVVTADPKTFPPFLSTSSCSAPTT